MWVASTRDSVDAKQWRCVEHDHAVRIPLCQLIHQPAHRVARQQFGRSRVRGTAGKQRQFLDIGAQDAIGHLHRIIL
jgi:hypothetical protein